MLIRLLLLATTVTIFTISAATAGGNGVVQTPSIFAPVSTPAYATRELIWIVFVITGTIFLVVAGLTVYAIMRFRRRQGDDGREPPQVYGSLQIELAWTVVPILIVVVLFLVTTRYIFAIEGRPPVPEALEVTIVGHQWWWEIRYPKLGIVTANELHVPVSDPAHPTPTFITLQSADVIHSFWIPQLAGKMDVIPNKTNRIWIDPQEPGGYVGQCAEYCGLQHAGMLLIVAVQSKEDFAKWAGPERCRGAGGARAVLVAVVHQLSRGSRDRGQRPVRARPDSSDEPADHRRRSDPEHAGEYSILDRRSGVPEAGCAHAGHEALSRRPGQSDRLPFGLAVREESS